VSIALFINILGILVLFVEVFLTVKKRAQNARDAVSDNKSLQFIWRAIGLGIALTFLSKQFIRHTVFSGNWFEIAALLLLLIGMAVRWYSVYYLGRNFTVNVAIIEGHELITSGPYRLVRHPSYTGLLLLFTGLGIHSNQVVGLVVLPVLVLLAVMNRICVEEVMLAREFGSEYDRYRNRTKLLFPWLY